MPKGTGQQPPSTPKATAPVLDSTLVCLGLVWSGSGSDVALESGAQYDSSCEEPSGLGSKKSRTISSTVLPTRMGSSGHAPSGHPNSTLDRPSNQLSSSDTGSRTIGLPRNGDSPGSIGFHVDRNPEWPEPL